MPVVKAETHGHKYPIVVDINCGARLQTLVRRYVNGGRLFVIYDAQVFALHAPTTRRILGPLAHRDRELVVPGGETAKDAATLSCVYDFLLAERISRDDLILAIGGGTTSDLAGFAAATMLRGVRWAVMPTTLLAMVDAAIGGKTGINHPAGKNLIGAFWQPEFVICDLQYLQTLDCRQVVSGLAEVLKYVALGGARCGGRPTVDRLAAIAESGDFSNLKQFVQLVHLSTAFKSAVVREDEHDQNKRLQLNFGHTFAHAIERSLGYGKLLHGEAVLLGMIAALDLGRRKGHWSKRHERLAEVAGSFLRYVPFFDLETCDLPAAMGLDKKRAGGKLRFVLIERPGKPILYNNIGGRQVNSAIAEMKRRYAELGGKDASDSGH